MKEGAATGRASPLAGTERAFFEDRREELRAGYQAVLVAEAGSYEKAARVAEAAKAQAWCGRILHDLKHKSPKRPFKTPDDLLREPPSDDPAVLEAIREQNAYFRHHAEHMDYAASARMGVPIGSGSVESLCSQFQNRLKRTGQFWTKEGFAALLRIVARYWNGELDSLWTASAA